MFIHSNGNSVGAASENPHVQKLARPHALIQPLQAWCFLAAKMVGYNS